jgi:hypothetical protein
VIKEIAIQISLKYIRSKEMIFQRFTILGNKRDLKYLIDPRFYTKRVFDNEVFKRSLNWEDGFIFCDKIELDNGIEVRYADESGGKYLDDVFFTIHDFVPSTFGCNYCNHNRGDVDEDHVDCNFFDKTTKRRKGSCKYFNQKKLFKT